MVIEPNISWENTFQEAFGSVVFSLLVYPLLMDITTIICAFASNQLVLGDLCK